MYNSGHGKAEFVDSTDSSYRVVNRIELPFFSIHMRFKRVLKIAESSMEFELDSFYQSPKLVPQALEIHGEYRVRPTVGGSEVRLFQSAKNGNRISALQKIVLESSIRKYFLSIQSHVQKNR